MNCNNNFFINSVKEGMWFSNPDVFKVYDLDDRQLSQAIENNIGEYNEIECDAVKIPHNEMAKGIIGINEYYAMKSVFELVYVGIEKEIASGSIQQRGGSFLRGEIQADWDLVANSDYCISQNSEQSIREEIVRRLKNREKSVYIIDYALYHDNPYDRESITEIMELILDTVCSKRKTIRIAGDDKPLEVVKSRFMKLDYSHISYVLSCLKENSTQVRNIKQYLLAALYNAPLTISNYYQAMYNNDHANGLV